MAETERIQLDYQPGWVEVKTRWTYGDKMAIAASKLPEGMTLLYRLVTGWHRGEHPTADELNSLDDKDAEKIIARLAELRKEQEDHNLANEMQAALDDALRQARREP